MLQVGRGLTEKAPEIGFSQDRKGAFASSVINGVIGGEFLRSFKVIFDYSHQQIILEPNEHLGETSAYSTEMSGIGP